MSRRRKPEAVLIGGGDGVLVKHCEDIAQARPLAVAALNEECGGHSEPITEVGAARVIWCRIIHALPSSWADADGYAWYYQTEDGPAPGVFRAVEFLR